MNWAILGLGGAAADFAKAITAVEGRVYAVGSRSLDKAKEFPAGCHAEKYYGSYESLLADDGIDIVYIATPHNYHHESIIASLRSGKHVFCEKAITMNMKQLSEAMALAASNSLILAEGMTIYHMPVIEQVRNLLRSGAMGTLKLIQISFGSLKEPDPTNRYFNPDLAGGGLLDIGTYALSLARYFLTSQPNEILTTVKRFETGVDEQSGILLKNNQEELAILSLSMRAKQPKCAIISTDRGFITIEDYARADNATITWSDNRVEMLQAGAKEDALIYEVEYMHRCVAGDMKENTLTLSADVMQIMDEVRKQWGQPSRGY